MLAVSRVAASIVDVVDVIAVRNGHVATALAVDVVVMVMHHRRLRIRGFALRRAGAAPRLGKR